MLAKMKEFMLDNERDMRERLFVLIATITIFSWFVTFIEVLVTGGALIKVLLLAAGIILSLAAVGHSIKFNRIRVGAIAISAGLILVYLPCTFFLGGGIYGDAPLWFLFAIVFVNMSLKDKDRMLMLTLHSAVIVVCWVLSYRHPELVSENNASMAHLFSAVAMLLISMTVTIMITLQNELYIREVALSHAQKKEIEALNASQSRFFSSMSHEIRTPINTIIGLNEMILRENISDEVAEDAANISSASKMLLHLINDILDMSKLSSGQMQLTPVAYRTGDMLSDIVGMLWLRAKQKGLEFHVDVAPDLPSELFGDEVRLKQILINVLGNAIKYTKEGSVSLSIQCGERNGQNINVVYTVSDTGMGIKKEDIPYLFTAFKRVDEKENRHIKGTGLGLSIVKQLTDLMDGKITVNSVYTKGSTFIIDIPQQAVSETVIGEIDIEARHEHASRPRYFKKFEAPDAKVLVVDDNASNLLVVKKLLRDTSVQVDTASSGAEALRKTLNNEYHVIFMDHLMPEMDGIECHRQIVAQVGGRCRGSKTVALTANAGGDSKALYEQEGFDGYLSKPISGEELETELCRLLPKDIVYLADNKDEIFDETISWMRSDRKKKNIIITTESVADLPQEIIDKYGIGVIPHMVRTDAGVFRDGLEIDTGGLLRYMRDESHKVTAVSPDVRTHEEFFAEQLERANNIIHISVTSAVANSGCPAAKEAADAFDNVTVIDSGHLSSGQGIMVIEACRLAEAGKTPAEIAERLEAMKNSINTSFVVDDPVFLARAEQVSRRIASVTASFMSRPMLVLKNGRIGIGRMFFGSRERTWRQYIDHALKDKRRIDDEILFITYVGLTSAELDEIRTYTESKMSFRKVYFRKASPAISVNCGAGTFGLGFRYKA